MSENNIRLIRFREVLTMTGLSRSSLYRFIEENQFPPQVQLGGRAVAWVEGRCRSGLLNGSPIVEWINNIYFYNP
ncbi:transcriptional regulator, putative [Vibrio cholerae]|nr:transcriptional regulator, putative [Vibrio cholerae]